MASHTIPNTEALYAGLSTALVKAAPDLIVDARATYVLGVGIAHAWRETLPIWRGWRWRQW